MLQCQTPPGYNVKIRNPYEFRTTVRTHSTVSVEVISMDQYEKTKALLENFYAEKSLFPDLFANLPAAETLIKRRINTVGSWDFSRAILEITDDGNAVFKLFLTDGHQLYVGLNLNEDGGNDSYFAYYEQEKCLLNGVGSFTDVVDDLAALKIL